MKKVAFFVNSLSGGGAEKILQTLLNRWNGDQWEVVIYSIKKEDVPSGYPRNVSVRFLFDALRDGDGPWRRLWVKVRNGLKLLVYRHFPSSVFHRLFIRGTYDVEAAFIEGYATRIAGGSTHAGTRKLAWVHIDLAANHWTLPAYRNAEEEKAVYRCFDTVACVSRNVRESLLELMGPLQDARVVYNPVDVPRIRDKAVEYVPERPDGKVLFCASGRLVPQKGFDRLVTACRYLAQEGFSFHLWILGEGPERETLEAMIKEGNLQDRITLLGHRENPYPYVKAADWLVCSSRSEGYSTVISESLILGTPVMATLCSGVPEQLRDGEFGLIAENHVLGLYRALEDILTGKVDYRDYCGRALRGGSRFDLDGQMSAVKRLFEETR